MNTTEILQQGKQVLLDRGWFQGNYADEAGKCVCAIGALRFANHGTPHWHEALSSNDGYYTAIRTLDEAAADILKVNIQDVDVVMFNDTPARTLDEVLALFDRAIEISQQPSKEQQ